MTTGARVLVAITGLVALGAVFATAGIWQWRKAAASSTAQLQFTAAAGAAVLTSPPLDLAASERFRVVAVRGEYVAEPQFLLDNMLHEGAAGYHVLTALRVPGARARLLVNRGWVSAGANRLAEPVVAVDRHLRPVVGRIERLPRAALRLGSSEPTQALGVAMVLQFPTAAEIEARLGEPVFDYQLLLDAGEPDGFVRDWRPPGIAPQRHLAYAGQWWLFAAGAFAAAVVMFARVVRRAP